MKSAKRHISHVRNSRPGHDLHISVNNRVVSSYRKSFIFTKLRLPSFAKIKLSRQFTIYNNKAGDHTALMGRMVWDIVVAMLG